jgi:type II secretory pathway component PulC
MNRLLCLRYVVTALAFAIPSGAQSTVTSPPDTVIVVQIAASELPALAAACDANLVTAQLAGGQRVVSVRMKSEASFPLLASWGLRNGDIIERMNGEAPRSASTVSEAVRALTPNRDLTLRVLHSSDRRTYVLHVDERAPTVETESNVTGDVMVLSEKAIEAQWAEQDPWTLLVIAAPRMAYDANGDVVGVTSASFSNIPLATALGLRDDDIIRSVNGYPINSEQAIFNVVNALEGERRFTAKLLRDGKPVTLRYRVE